VAIGTLAQRQELIGILVDAKPGTGRGQRPSRYSTAECGDRLRKQPDHPSPSWRRQPNLPRSGSIRRAPRPTATRPSLPGHHHRRRPGARPSGPRRRHARPRPATAGCGRARNHRVAASPLLTFPPPDTGNVSLHAKSSHAQCEVRLSDAAAVAGESMVVTGLNRSEFVEIGGLEVTMQGSSSALIISPLSVCIACSGISRRRPAALDRRPERTTGPGTGHKAYAPARQ
jgi:hypothetical protein